MVISLVDALSLSDMLLDRCLHELVTRIDSRSKNFSTCRRAELGIMDMQGLASTYSVGKLAIAIDLKAVVDV